MMSDNDVSRERKSLESVKKEMLEKLKSIGTPKVEKRAVGFQYFRSTIDDLLEGELNL